jgi:hypothetical protein
MACHCVPHAFIVSTFDAAWLALNNAPEARNNAVHAVVRIEVLVILMLLRFMFGGVLTRR